MRRKRKVAKRVWSFMLVMALLTVYFAPESAKALSVSVLYRAVTEDGWHEANTVDEACQALEDDDGYITLYTDDTVNYDSVTSAGYIKKGVQLTVSSGCTLTIGKNGLRVEGELEIYGKVDLNQSPGILFGDGAVTVDSGLTRRSYDVNQSGSIALEADEIRYGQKLSEAAITADKIKWTAPIDGTWQFQEPDCVPQAGTGEYDVVFTPTNTLSYEAGSFPKCGRVKVNSTVPERESYEADAIHVGQTLLAANPKVSYISPVTGEKVSGKFAFDESQQVMLSVGDLQIKGTFTPDDTGYTAVSEYFEVHVDATEAEVSTMPVIRNQGSYGQTLEQILFLAGKCTNPYTGQTIRGTWEWKDSSERLQLGTKSYQMLFLPDADGYETKEIDVEVTTLPKEMENLTLPVCSDIEYGQSLADAKLSFYKNEYGTFHWQNEELCPTVKNDGAVLVFRPTDTVTYDWSKLEGYDEESKTVAVQIPVNVRAVKGTLPVVSSLELTEGETLSACELPDVASSGTLRWKNPQEIVEESGEYEAYFVPADTANYDWSSYNPDEQGRITVKLGVTAEKVETIVMPTATAKPDKTDTSEVTDTVEVTDTPEATDTPKTTDTAEVTDTSEATGTSQVTDAPEVTAVLGVTDAPEVTAAPTATAKPKATATPKPSEKDEDAASPVVITQMVAKISTIKKNRVSVKKTTLQKTKRKKTSAKLVWKKIKGVTYQLQYGTSANWKKSKKKLVSTNSYTLKNLKKGQSYYVRIRCMKKKKGKKYYSAWSAKKKI